MSWHPVHRHKGLITWVWGRPVPAQHPRCLYSSFLLQKGFCTGEQQGQILPSTHSHGIQVGPHSGRHPEDCGMAQNAEHISSPLAKGFSWPRALCRPRSHLLLLTAL